jgi:hypothetical protein
VARKTLTYFSRQESETGEIKLDYERPESVEMLLLYLYTLEAPDFEKHRGPFLVAFDAIVLGDQYLVDGLVDAGQRFFTRVFGSESVMSKWDKVAKFKPHSIFCIRTFYENEQAAFKVIRAVAVATIAKMKDKVMDREDFQALVREKPEFAFDLIKQLQNKAGGDVNRSG